MVTTQFKFSQKIMPFLGIGLLIILVLIGLVISFYVVVLGAIIGFVLLIISYIKSLFFVPKKKNQVQKYKPGKGNVYEHEEMNKK